MELFRLMMYFKGSISCERGGSRDGEMLNKLYGDLVRSDVPKDHEYVSTLLRQYPCETLALCHSRRLPCRNALFSDDHSNLGLLFLP